MRAFNEGVGLSDARQQYEHTKINNGVREQVDRWCLIPNPANWRVTSETARLLQHCRQHPFESVRPFYCQVEAVETAIWLTEVAPQMGKLGQNYLDYLPRADGHEEHSGDQRRSAPLLLMSPWILSICHCVRLRTFALI